MKGFTLVELLAVSSLILLLTGTVLVLGRQGSRELALVRSAERLAFDLERAKALALQTRSFAGAIPCGYGIFFSQRSGENTSYILYADTREGAITCASGDIKRQDSSEDVEVIPLERRIEIVSLFPSENEWLYVVFAPPRPQLKMHPASTRAQIQLRVLGGVSQKTVVVEESGEIHIE